MPKSKKYHVELNEQQRQQLQDLITKGHASARVIRRAHALLLSAEDKEVAAALHLNAQTVYQLRKRFAQEGLDATLYDKPRPGGKPKLGGKQEALLVALACSDPDERETWTMQLLADKLVELSVVDEISDEPTVGLAYRLLLPKHGQSRDRYVHHLPHSAAEEVCQL